MRGAKPALALPPSAFDVILGDPQLCTRDKCAVEATCRAWRDLARACSAAAAAVAVPSRLDTEERLDSLGMWLYRRAAGVRHLQFEHFQCQRLDPIAQNILETVAPALTSLSLTLSKHQRNRRGVPGPASLAWAPPLPALRRLELTVAWEAEALDLPRWAPAAEELTLRWRVYGLGGLTQFDGPAAALPPGLRRLGLYGLFADLDYVLRPVWTAGLRRLAVNWPGWANGHNVMPASQPARIEAALAALTGLTELAINVSTFGGDEEEQGSDPEDPLLGCQAALRAVSALTGLRVLKLAGVSKPYDAHYLDPLTKLEALHLLGGPFWGFHCAPLPALTELALVVVAPPEATYELFGERTPEVLQRPGVRRLILNWDGSGRGVGTSGWWAHKWGHGEFDGAAQTLEELVVVETKRIAPLSGAEEGPDNEVGLAAELVGPVVAAGRGGQLRVGLGDGTCWGRRCLEAGGGGEAGRLRVGAPPADLLEEVAAWGRWRLEREAGNVLDDEEYEFEDGELLL